MVDIIHRVGIKSTLAHVYNAITSLEGLAHWWTNEVSGDAKLDGKITFTFRAQTGDIKGAMVMKVEKLIANNAVVWRCVEGPAEWIDTSITFDLSEQDGQTILLFGHRNWREAVEFTSHCSMKWATFLLSLRAYVETGTGQPSPNDVKIDNWN